MRKKPEYSLRRWYQSTTRDNEATTGGVVVFLDENKRQINESYFLRPDQAPPDLVIGQGGSYYRYLETRDDNHLYLPCAFPWIPGKSARIEDYK